jgi:tRNA threonylcarbamoyl adenosine modification protein YjeE
MSVDADGRLVPKHVVGWHTSPVAGRRILKLTYRSAKRAGAGKVSVQLTEDHPVLTRRGYVPARDLVPDDEVNTGQGMSQVAFDVACGTILGDGHLNRKSAHLAFAHSQRQRDWALFKATALEAFSPQVSSLEVSAVAGGPQIYPVVHVRTRAHRAFGILRSNFYGARKRVPLWMAERLNPRMLAVWYLDDGHLRERPGRRSSAEIATHGFDGHDLALLRAGLGRLGVISQVRAGRLVFGVDATRTLTDLIAPYVPESMRYKLPRDIAMSRPFRPEAYEPGPDVALFDSVVVEDVTHEPRTDTTAYCLDVADTHNFVTAGGVVHNCRPPGNRDPQPDEIEACTPWLVEQISLIQPRVIDARQLRDEVRAEHRDRHHATARAGARMARTHRDPDVPPGGDPARRRREVPPVPAAARRLPSRASHAGRARPRAAVEGRRRARRGPDRGARRRPAGAVLTMRVGVRTSSAEETRELGEAVASLLRARDAVVLTGELGAGKTTFVQGVARGLGIEEQVSSPTFTLVKEYSGILDLAHVDVYRLDRMQEVVDLGLEELGGGDDVLLVEWGDTIEELLPDDRLQVELATADAEENVRTIEISASGTGWVERFAELEAAVMPWAVTG